MSEQPSETPLTDSEQEDINSCTDYPELMMVEAFFSRKLELALRKAKAELEAHGCHHESICPCRICDAHAIITEALNP